MRNIFRFLFAVFYLNIGTNSLRAQWVQANGPSGGSIFCFVVSDTNLFAGTDGGVFLSTNKGTSWSAVNAGLTNNHVHAFAVSSNGAGGTNVFAGTFDGGVFLSTNNGTSWARVDSGLSNTHIHVLGVSNTNVFAGTEGGGIFLSTNDGRNWTAADSGLTNSFVLSFAVSANGTGGTNIFAGTFGGGVFLSTNNGANWTAVNTGLTNIDVTALAVSPNGAGGTNIFAGTFGGGVFLSTNDGTNWTAANTDLTNTYIRAIAVSPTGTGGKNVFAGTVGGGIFLSTDTGTNWTAVNTGLTNHDITTLAISPNRTAGTNLFAGTHQGLFLSTSNGTSWTAIDSGLTKGTKILASLGGSLTFNIDIDGPHFNPNSAVFGGGVGIGGEVHVKPLFVVGIVMGLGDNEGIIGYDPTTPYLFSTLYGGTWIGKYQIVAGEINGVGDGGVGYTRYTSLFVGANRKDVKIFFFEPEIRVMFPISGSFVTGPASYKFEVGPSEERDITEHSHLRDLFFGLTLKVGIGVN
ncbi:MAG: hypothetical protein WAO19_05190 [Candidatus Kryptoniota bacterium]